MSERKLVMHDTDLCYLYDGSLAGFYTCVHEAVYQKELPLSVCIHGHQPLLLEKHIATDAKKALSVRNAIHQRISPRALELTEGVFLTPLAEKEKQTLLFLRLGFEMRCDITRMLAHPLVSALLAAEKHLLGECHLLKGFVRFADYEGNLFATIRPKNFVLPLLTAHFTQRYPEENFMIYDATHQAALLYEHGRAQILPMEKPLGLSLSEEERLYQALWKQFYHTLSIEERENLACRQSHMPKRYWSEMLEVQEETTGYPR